MAEKREKIIKVRVSAEEFETLKMLKTKPQLAEWMRDACLNYGQGDLLVQAKGPEPVDPELLRQLASVGNNMNQVARKINTNEWGPSDKIEVLAQLKAIERQLEELRIAHR
jgi:hypothetical protein